MSDVQHTIDSRMELNQNSATGMEDLNEQADTENQRIPEWEERKWDVFEETPRKDEGNGLDTETIEKLLKLLKLLTYILSFVVVLCSAVSSKLSLLFMTSHLSWTGCKKISYPKETLEIQVPQEEVASWLWCLFFIMIVPEMFTLLKCSKWCLFKSFEKPQRHTFVIVLLTETFQAVGLSLLVFIVLPRLSAVKGAMVTNGVCFVPCLLSFLSHIANERHRWLRRMLDFVALCCQATVFVVWIIYPVKNVDDESCLRWAIPLASVLISLSWWENYLNKQSRLSAIRFLVKIREEIDQSRSFTYLLLSMWRILVFLSCMVVVYVQTIGTNGEVAPLFEGFSKIFGGHTVTLCDRSRTGDNPDSGMITSAWAPVSLMLIQMASSAICYYFVKFACRTCIQGIGFALPISLTVPVAVAVLVSVCYYRSMNMEDIEIPHYLFWNCEEENFMDIKEWKKHTYVWPLWAVSQIWITIHIWIPKFSRVGHRLFVRVMYCGVVLDQSLTLNRWRDENEEQGYEKIEEEEEEESEYDSEMTLPAASRDSYYETPMERDVTINMRFRSASENVHRSDNIVRIYMCATMWHETSDEMVQMFKSVFRMDEDQCARRIARHFIGYVKDAHYYTCETHIFFDDAFDKKKLPNKERVTVVNRFVKQLVTVIDTAASEIHKKKIILRPPRKIPTPYGGKLEWILPGKTKLIAHLKDKSKIRHRKRWSQVMYMYYLLGFRLMDRPISAERKAIMASKTFLLALDGDVDFRPAAVQRLVELMVKHRDLGAACGRIHPIGRGPMVWYQKYEYAVGHWLQKATEHMIGCVLCSPGCFSLFRAEAIMDSNVMKKYTTKPTEALHFVQYDQGEDRWLCTLLLKQGYRIEYSAASDALTQCPEGFGEFYSQRRRWGPSTMANIMDLLMDYKHTVQKNNNISFLYIVYQMTLMLGSILGPGNIFLMLVGSMVAAFKISNLYAFNLNIIPILLYIIVCLLAKNDIQVFVAQVLSALYALLMVAVLVGISIELTEDGIDSPSAIFLIVLAGSSIIAALVHPQEFSCMYSSILYFISIPSMYLLLFIYSIANLNCISWGTREVEPTEDDEDDKQKLPDGAAAAADSNANQPDSHINKVLQWIGFKSSKKEEEGNISFSFGNFFKILCCTHPKPSEQEKLLIKLNYELDKVQMQLGNMEKMLQSGHVPRTNSMRRRSSISGLRRALHQDQQPLTPVLEDEELENDFDDIPEEEFEEVQELEPQPKPAPIKRDDLINPYWLEDLEKFLAEKEALYEGEEILEAIIEEEPDPRDIPDSERDEENKFWQELIDKYLYPLDEDKQEKDRISRELKDLRNKVVFTILMLNAIFVLIVLLLQSHKDLLHVKWPLGVKVDIKYIPKTGEILIHKEPLKLDPIGLVFMLCFTIILIIQFIAMLFHRFETFTTIMADISLPWCNSKVKDVKGDAFLRHNAVQLVREMQRLDRGYSDTPSVESTDEPEPPANANIEPSSPQMAPSTSHRRGTVFALSKKEFSRPVAKDLEEVFLDKYAMVMDRRDTLIGRRASKASPLMKEALRRRDTLAYLQTRRNTLTPIINRRGTVARFGSDTESLRAGSIRSTTRSIVSNAAIPLSTMNEAEENHSEHGVESTSF